MCPCFCARNVVLCPCNLRVYVQTHLYCRRKFPLYISQDFNASGVMDVAAQVGSRSVGFVWQCKC
jgi:hypothetical protein